MPLRYEARFSNGAWKVFDTIEYADVWIVGRQVDALESAARANAAEVNRRAARA